MSHLGSEEAGVKTSSLMSGVCYESGQKKAVFKYEHFGFLQCGQLKWG